MAGSVPRVDVEGIAAYLAQQPEVAVAYLFGSVARGQAGPLSDVDIAVLFGPDLGPEETVERQLDLLVGLERFADCEVQVTVLNRASVLLAYQVVRYGVRIVERDPAQRIAFEVRTMKMYFDIKPIVDSLNRNLLQQIREGGLSGQTRRHPRTLEAAKRIHQRLTRAPGS